MGHSASAKLAYGYNLGDLDVNGSFDVADTGGFDAWPDWLKGTTKDDWEAEKRVKARGLELIDYGYDFSHKLVGIEIAWAIDYGFERLNEEDLLGVKYRKRVTEALRTLGAPETVLNDLSFYLLAIYS